MGNLDSKKIDTHKALLAADAVMRHGESTSRGMHWHGITVMTDLDGYTVTLKDDNVDLQLLFHHKFQMFVIFEECQ